MAVTLKGQTAVYEGTSTDTKPTDADNNAIFKELDTGIRYYYDGTDWNEIPSSGGGGGGTGTDNYNELNNKPSINGTTLSGNKSLDNLGIQAKLTFDSAPTEDSENPVTSGGVYTALATNIQGIKVNGSTVNPDSNKVVSITVPTSAADVSALPDTTKYAAALSLTINSSTFVVTGQLKDQNGDNLGTAQTIDLPLESVVVGGSYDSQTKKVILTLQNGNTIEFSVADLVSGLQTELSASNKLNPAYINYDSTHRAVSDTEKSEWNGKQNAIDSSHKLSSDLVDDTNAINKFATAEELEQIQTNKNNILLLETMNGAKNICDWANVTERLRQGLSDVIKTDTSLTITSNAPWGHIAYSIGTLSAGEYVAIAKITNYSVESASCKFGIDTSTASTTPISGNGVVTHSFSLNEATLVRLFFYANYTSTSYVNSYTASDIMVITKAAYDAGFTDYQPYAMSNAELTAAIQAIQAQLANQ